MQAMAAVPIAYVPDTLESAYDLTWELDVVRIPTKPLLVNIEQTADKKSYQLQVEARSIAWNPVGLSTGVRNASVALSAGCKYQLTIKRRLGTVAVLLDHRTVLIAPAPVRSGGRLAFQQVPAGVTVHDACYQRIEPRFFGDDFMRPELLERLLTNQEPWFEDDIWRTAFFQKAYPASDPHHPDTGAVMTNPWQLSLFPVARTTTNAFWMLYTGTGPSWVVADPTQVTPTWDRYFVEAAVKTDYDSEVGLLAGYQDNNNYILFRWRSRAAVAQGQVGAELLAIVDGRSQVLASSDSGFDPGQWYTLRINFGWRRVQALIDGVVCLEAANTGPAEGGIGLYAQGVDHPQRPALDTKTLTMFTSTDETTGDVMNEATEAVHETSCLCFDDVRVGDWEVADHAVTDPTYPLRQTGTWDMRTDGTVRNTFPGRLILETPTDWERYTLTTRLQLPTNGMAGLLLRLNPAGTSGYQWLLSATGQQLRPMTNGKELPPVDRSPLGVPPGTWADLRVEIDGPYLACYCNGDRVLEVYDSTRVPGQCGFIAFSPGTVYGPCTVACAETVIPRIFVHPGFERDRLMATWSSTEADWMPAVLPAITTTSSGLSRERAGAAAPYPTDLPGLYWHKGGHYHDLRVVIPMEQETVAGQELYLTTDADIHAGYTIAFTRQGAQTRVRFLRQDQLLGDYPVTIDGSAQFLLERRGSYLVLRLQLIDPDDVASDPAVVREQLVFCYRDSSPLPAEQIGLLVTAPALPAAAVRIDSDRIRETFEQAPTGWMVQSGVWSIMARYSCDPKWNWFGGFGAGTPSVWSKTRLEGDQTVEAYLGIKMLQNTSEEEYRRRYRDLCLTICANGTDATKSGYALIRAGHVGGQPVTMLMRNGVIVQQSTQPAHLLPPREQGHWQWFATRLEKHGAVVQVFIDNTLAMTYTDPDPLPGGYTGIWTRENGIMIGRVNFSAERMTLGAPGR